MPESPCRSAATFSATTFTGNLALGGSAAPGRDGPIAGGGAINNAFSLLMDGLAAQPGTLTIESVGGTPVLTAQGSSGWRPRVTVHGDGPTRRIELPVVPNRCDDHAFLEAGGATAFIVHLVVGGTSGDVILRMSNEGAANAIRFARDSCGLD